MEQDNLFEEIGLHFEEKLLSEIGSAVAIANEKIINEESKRYRLYKQQQQQQIASDKVKTARENIAYALEEESQRRRRIVEEIIKRKRTFTFRFDNSRTFIPQYEWTPEQQFNERICAADGCFNTISMFRHKSTKFCSIKCRENQKRKLCRISYNKRRHNLNLLKECKWCGSEFHANKISDQYCSLVCRNSFEKKRESDKRKRKRKEQIRDKQIADHYRSLYPILEELEL